MKSVVSFDLVDPISVGECADYPSIGVTLQTEERSWTGVSVEVEHDEDEAPADVVGTARETVRGLVALIGVGRGLEPTLGVAHVRSESALATAPTTGMAQIKCGGCVTRSLLATPSEHLVLRVRSDPKLQRQTEALNAARVAPDVVSQIRWSYMVLEQENARGQGYTPPDDYRHLRDGVSHPELDGASGKAYFQSALGVDFPDLGDPAHLAFLQSQSPALLAEATRIVEKALCGDEFWQ